MARVTVYDVAEKAGVSTATVSFAFRHPDKVKDDTKAKVLRVADELGYVPSGNARSLAKGRTGTLGMYAFDMLLEKPQGVVSKKIGPMYPPCRPVCPMTTSQTFSLILYTLTRCSVVSSLNAGKAARACSWGLRWRGTTISRDRHRRAGRWAGSDAERI